MMIVYSLWDLSSCIDDLGLEVSSDDFLILQNAGPRSGHGMPESGCLPIPSKLSKAGVKDMVRISDARMSGTIFGITILHATSEAAGVGAAWIGSQWRRSWFEREESTARFTGCRRGAVPLPRVELEFLEQCREIANDRVHIWPDLMPRTQPGENCARLVKDYNAAGATVFHLGWRTSMPVFK